MQEVPLEKLLGVTNKSLFKLVTLVSKRAIEIAEGSPRLSETGGTVKPATIAMREIAEGKITCKECGKKAA